MFTSNDSAAKTVTIDVMTARLQTGGRRLGGPLLLVYEQGEHGANASNQALSLTQAGYDVIAFDHAGCGQSTDAKVAEAARLLAGLGVGVVTVVGIGSGSLVALMLAVRHPGVVSGVITWEPGAIGSTSLVLRTFAAREFHPRDIGMVVGHAPSTVIAAAVCELALRIQGGSAHSVPHRGAYVTHAEVLTHNGVPDPRRWAGWTTGRAF